MIPKVAGVVVLFKPNSSVIRNIRSYLPYLDCLFAVDNTDPFVQSEQFYEELRNVSDKVFYIRNNENLGVAKALNLAAKMALERQYEWLLTMDQDSCFDKPMIAAYWKCFGKFYNLDKVAIFAPFFMPVPVAESESCQYEEVLTVITSGNLLNLNLLKKIGGFEEKLFIDEVDHDYCLRARLMGYKILKFKNIYFKHEIGETRLIKIGNRIGHFFKHDPKRLYYITRNNLYIWKKYGRVFPKYVRKSQIDFWLITFLCEAILWDRSPSKIVQIIKGILDFFRDKYGK